MPKPMNSIETMLREFESMELPSKKFVIFGDSITQQSHRLKVADETQEGFAMATQLQEDYIRQLDVVTRGFSGYNTTNALAILPYVFRYLTPENGRIEYLTVLFGANDACNSDAISNQHVPLKTFKENLKCILTHPAITVHNPRIVLITTPPINEHQLIGDRRDDGTIDMMRSASNAQAYASACREVYEELKDRLDIRLCDLWAKMMSCCGWNGTGTLVGDRDAPKSDELSELLRDGM